MELTVDQMIQQGVAAHNQGNLQEAERLYRAILQLVPTHPDASHNLGLLAVAVNNIEFALPLFKTAIEQNPKIEQFWLSYIDALTIENEFKHAKRVIKKAKKAGFVGKKLKAAEGRLLRSPQGRVNQPSVELAVPSEAQINSLLVSYQNGRYENAESLARLITQQFPDHPLSWKVLGTLLGQASRHSEAIIVNEKSVQLAPDDAETHYNLGNTLRETGRLEEAKMSYAQAITLRSEYAEAHNNLGATQQELGRLDEAETSYRQSLELKYDNASAHGNLGATLQELGRLEEAEVSCRQAIALKYDFVAAHYNLGNMLNELGRFEEAEASYRQAIVYNPGLAEAHNNLGDVLKQLGRLEEAEASCRQAIVIKPGYASAYTNLGIVLHACGEMDDAIQQVEKAYFLDCDSRVNGLLLNVLRARKVRDKTKVIVDTISQPDCDKELNSHPIIFNRAVEPELIARLSQMQSREMDKALNTPVYGNGRCSLDYSMFKEAGPIVRTVERDLISIMKLALKSEIYVYDSFFNIYGAGGGIRPHTHLNKMDKETYLNLAIQKYSLVYYLSVGDQSSSEPGILRFYDPEEEILPCEGMIVTFPASRQHSAIYSGKQDRVMIGVNFYTL